MNPEKIFSTSLLAFSLINLPSLVKNPVCPAEHLNRLCFVWNNKGELAVVVDRTKIVVADGGCKSRRWEENGER